MSYKLEYPYTEEERVNFIVTYNHQQGLKIETVDNFVDIEVEIETEDGEVATETKQENMPTYYALEKNEIMVDDEPIVDPNYETEQAKIIQKQLVEYNYNAKAKKAYGGIIINDIYLFETNETSQSMITASLIGLQSAPDETTLNWKMYANNQPIVVPLTKVQLAQLFAFALNMVNVSFGLEGVRNNDLTTATVEQLNDKTWVEQYKIATDFAFNQINNKINVVLIEEPIEEETEVEDEIS